MSLRTPEPRRRLRDRIRPDFYSLILAAAVVAWVAFLARLTWELLS